MGNNNLSSPHRQHNYITVIKARYWFFSTVNYISLVLSFPLRVLSDMRLSNMSDYHIRCERCLSLSNAITLNTMCVSYEQIRSVRDLHEGRSTIHSLKIISVFVYFLWHELAVKYCPFLDNYNIRAELNTHWTRRWRVLDVRGGREACPFVLTHTHVRVN